MSLFLQATVTHKAFEICVSFLNVSFLKISQLVRGAVLQTQFELSLKKTTIFRNHKKNGPH